MCTFVIFPIVPLNVNVRKTLNAVASSRKLSTVGCLPLTLQPLLMNVIGKVLHNAFSQTMTSTRESFLGQITPTPNCESSSGLHGNMQ